MRLFMHKWAHYRPWKPRLDWPLSRGRGCTVNLSAPIYPSCVAGRQFNAIKGMIWQKTKPWTTTITERRNKRTLKRRMKQSGRECTEGPFRASGLRAPDAIEFPTLCAVPGSSNDQLAKSEDAMKTIMRGTEIRRVSNTLAESLTVDGWYTYVPKSVWKKGVRDAKLHVSVSDVSTTAPTPPKTKQLKRKVKTT